MASNKSNLQRSPILHPFCGGSPRIKEDIVEEIEEWFDANALPLLVINDDPPINAITVEKFQTFLDKKTFHRRHMHYPHYGEIMAELENLNMANVRVLTKEQFLYILDRFQKFPDIKHELKLAFKLFDTEKRDFMDIDELHETVTRYGDKFEPEEVLEFMRDANFRGDGMVIYEEFVDSMFRVAPDLYDMEAEYLYEDPDEDPSVPPELSVEEPDTATEIIQGEVSKEPEVQPDSGEKADGGQTDADGGPLGDSKTEGKLTENNNNEASAKDPDGGDENAGEPVKGEMEAVQGNETDGGQQGDVAAPAADA